MGNAITRKYDMRETHDATGGHESCWSIYHGKTKDEISRDVSIWICSKEGVGKREPSPERHTMDSIFAIMRQDVKIMQSIDSPHVIKPLEMFQDSQNILCIVTDRVICSLADLLYRFKNVPNGLNPDLAMYFDTDNDKGLPTLSEAEISRGIYSVAEGIQFLHHIQRRIHLAIAPENIILTPGGTWKLCGFGHSITFPGEEFALKSYPYFKENQKDCKSISIEPNLSYTSPECTLGGYDKSKQAHRHISIATDIFSLGVIAYETYTYCLHTVPQASVSASDVLHEPIIRVTHGNAASHNLGITIVEQLDMSAIPQPCEHLIKSMMALNTSVRTNGIGVTNHAFFNSGALAVLKSIDALTTRDIGAQASQLMALPPQLMGLPGRLLEGAVLPSLCRLCTTNPSLWTYTMPLCVFISGRCVSNSSYASVMEPFLRSALSKYGDGSSDCVLAFVRCMDHIFDKFDLSFVSESCIKFLANAVEKGDNNVKACAISVLCERKIRNTISKEAMCNLVLPMVCKEACKNSDSIVQCYGLYFMSLVVRQLDSHYIINNFLPSLKYIVVDYKNDAGIGASADVLLACAGVYQALGDSLGPAFMTKHILPVMMIIMGHEHLMRNNFELTVKVVTNMLQSVMSRRTQDLVMSEPKVSLGILIESDATANDLFPTAVEKPSALKTSAGGVSAQIQADVTAFLPGGSNYVPPPPSKPPPVMPSTSSSGSVPPPVPSISAPSLSPIPSSSSSSSSIFGGDVTTNTSTTSSNDSSGGVLGALSSVMGSISSISSNTGNGTTYTPPVASTIIAPSNIPQIRPSSSTSSSNNMGDFSFLSNTTTSNNSVMNMNMNSGSIGSSGTSNNLFMGMAATTPTTQQQQQQQQPSQQQQQQFQQPVYQHQQQQYNMQQQQYQQQQPPQQQQNPSYMANIGNITIKDTKNATSNGKTNGYQPPIIPVIGNGNVSQQQQQQQHYQQQQYQQQQYQQQYQQQQQPQQQYQQQQYQQQQYQQQQYQQQQYQQMQNRSNDPFAGL